VVWEITPFIATIAVPQKKKGEISKRGDNQGDRGIREVREFVGMEFKLLSILSTKLSIKLFLMIVMKF
jgi:hypothetical protein